MTERNFVSFFMSAQNKYPSDVLCLRGQVWQEYEHLRFRGDDAPEELIHFVHADACLIPKSCLEEIASVKMPESSFTLVDDYWMSFVLNHRFGRKLRKLSTKDASKVPLERADDSDTVGLALHTRPEVQDARIRLYIHHMVQGWPAWPSTDYGIEIDLDEVKRQKQEIWATPFIGYNISSKIDEHGIEVLSEMGVSCVRIGAVGVGKEVDREFFGFLSNSDAAEKELKNLDRTVTLLAAKNISAVLTIECRVSPATWYTIAEHFAYNPFVVGYDVINEPFTATEQLISWSEIAETKDPDIPLAHQKFVELIKSIREVDKMTPIIIEPTFWAHCDALQKLPIEELLKEDPDLIVSFHFYEPMLLTQRFSNKQRFRFPGEVPLYDTNNPDWEKLYWDSELIHTKFKSVLAWAQKHGVRIFLGEFGISRDIPGAEDYLRVIMESCKDLKMIGFLFSFRDDDWEAMDYELGTSELNIAINPNWEEGLMKIIVDGIRGHRS